MDFGRFITGIAAIGVGAGTALSSQPVFGAVVALAGVYLLGTGIKE